MKNKSTLVILIAGLVILLSVGYLLYNWLSAGVDTQQLAQEPEQKEEQTQSAPDFTVYDAEGNEVKLSDFIGKPVVLNFWASWCGPCKAEMPFFDAMYNDYKDKVQVVMVNVTDGSRDTVESVTAFYEDSDYTFERLREMGVALKIIPITDD